MSDQRLQRLAAGMTRSRLDRMFDGVPEKLSMTDVVRLLEPAVTRRQVERMVRDGVIPAFKLGGRWIIFRDDLRDAIAAGANLPPTDDSS